MSISKDTILSYYNFESLSSDIIELAKEIMPDKVIYINFLNNKVQVTMKVSKHDTNVNIKEGETIPVENAVCNNIDYENGKPLVLEDISNNNLDDKVNETIKNANLGSYLGIPIVFKNGERFGALCAAHHDKTTFDKNDINLLQKISNLFTYYLELERQAYVDSLTGLENTRFLLLNQGDIIKSGGLAIMLDLDNFKLVNDNLGHHVGDLVLKELGQKLKYFTKQFDDFVNVRLGGDEFFIYLKDNISKEGIETILKVLSKDLTKWNTNIGEISLTSSIGAHMFGGKQYDDFKDLYEKTDSLLYKAKNKRKNTFVLK